MEGLGSQGGLICPLVSLFSPPYPAPPPPQPQADSFSLISQAAAVTPPSFCLPLLLPPPTTHMGFELCASCSNEINNITLTGLCSSLSKWNSGAECIDPIKAPWCLSAWGGGWGRGTGAPRELLGLQACWDEVESKKTLREACFHSRGYRSKEQPGHAGVRPSHITWAWSLDSFKPANS